MKILNDFSTSVHKALSEIDPKYMDYPGVVVCGTHTPFNPEQLIDEIQEARENEIPFLGICFGHQLAAIEYARNVLGTENATSEEWFDYSTWDDMTRGLPSFVVRKRPELKVGLHDGETWWSNYDVDKDILDKWVKADNFITIPFHPEYQSSKDKPHPILVEFLNHCKNHAK